MCVLHWDTGTFVFRMRLQTAVLQLAEENGAQPLPTPSMGQGTHKNMNFVLYAGLARHAEADLILGNSCLFTFSCFIFETSQRKFGVGNLH